MHNTRYCIAICISIVLPVIHCAALWDIFGTSNQNRGPKPEVGECSHWDRSDVFFATYNSDDLVGFHRSYPLGSYVIVLNEQTNKSVSVRIVASGPVADGRLVELSPAAFAQVSRLSEVVFDCRVYPPAEVSAGGGSGLRPGGGYPVSGGHATGSGYPTTGTGYPPTGSGYPTTGSGFPTTGSGYPSTGGGYPTTGSGYPTTGSGYPTTGSGYPTTGSGYPSTGGGYDYPGHSAGEGSLGGGYDSIDTGVGTLNPGFGPPPVLSGNGAQKHNPLQKQNW